MSDADIDAEELKELHAAMDSDGVAFDPPDRFFRCLASNSPADFEVVNQGDERGHAVNRLIWMRERFKYRIKELEAENAQLRQELAAILEHGTARICKG